MVVNRSIVMIEALLFVCLVVHGALFLIFKLTFTKPVCFNGQRYLL